MGIVLGKKLNKGIRLSWILSELLGVECSSPCTGRRQVLLCWDVDGVIDQVRCRIRQVGHFLIKERRFYERKKNGPTHVKRHPRILRLTL